MPGRPRLFDEMLCDTRGSRGIELNKKCRLVERVHPSLHRLAVMVRRLVLLRGGILAGHALNLFHLAVCA
jgi:hypothetical protein